MIEIDRQTEQQLKDIVSDSGFSPGGPVGIIREGLSRWAEPLDTPDQCRAFGRFIAPDLESIYRPVAEVAEGPTGNSEAMTGADTGRLESFFVPAFHTAQAAVSGCVDELTIPDDAKRYIKGRLDHVAMRLDSSTHHLTVVENGMVVIHANPRDFVEVPLLYLHGMGSGNEYRDLTRNYAVLVYGHELGHAVARVLVPMDGTSDGDPVERYGKQFMDDYHVRYTTDLPDGKMDILAAAYSEGVRHERFADYFGQAVREGLGIPRTLWDENIVFQLMAIYGSGLGLEQLRDVYDAAFMEIDRRNAHVPIMDKLWLYDMKNGLDFGILNNTGMHMLKPFPRTAVETIIADAWEDVSRFPGGIR
jgi:hypothetical protein